MNPISELKHKHSRVAKLLEREKLDAIVLSTQADFAWFTGGKDNHVVTASEMGSAHLVIKADKVWAVCENIEAQRVTDEEVGGLDIPVEPVNWWDGNVKDTIERLAGSTNIGSDAGMWGFLNIEPVLAPLRFSLSEPEIERYRWVAENAAECMDYACRNLSPGMTEHEVAALLNEQIISRGMVPQVTLIAADERIYNYRHPIPTDKRIDKHVMVVTGTKRYGLVVSLSRIVHFGPLPDEIRKKQDACAFVDATFIQGTKPGCDVADIFNSAVKAYAQMGYPDEWKNHHQGGSTGYKGREFRATPTIEAVVQPNQAYAWNPSIKGTKTEDTILALPGKTEILSEIPGWPAIEVKIGDETIARPDILIR